MAVHYHVAHRELGLRNFGDDINSWFLSRLFHASIIKSQALCILGIGTILNDNNAAQIAHYDQKIVFSSGVGYGEIKRPMDETWDFVCVRGPRSAEALGLAPKVGICDGAILLGDMFPPKSASVREGDLFIPHARTDWSCGVGLRRICQESGLGYLSPGAPSEVFIEGVRSARRVITEAMHGAILADTLRTPWIPVHLLYHHTFKWQDWMESVELPYECQRMRPVVWNDTGGQESSKGMVRSVYHRLKLAQAAGSLRRISQIAKVFLSADDVIADRKRRLGDCVQYINNTYAV